MRSVFGGLLVLIGIGMAALWMPGHDGEQQLAIVTGIATQGIASVARTEPGAAGRPAGYGARTFSPQTPLLSQESPPPNIPGLRGVAAALPAEPAATVANPVTTPAPPVSGDHARPALRPVAESPRPDLVRNMQRELKRVGCYHGEVSGEWGAASKRALEQFMERVNASLPHEEPDYILLTLVQGHTGVACGKLCPAGQTAAEGGRCMPNAVLAQTGRRTQEVASAPIVPQPQAHSKETARRTAAREPQQPAERAHVPGHVDPQPVEHAPAPRTTGDTVAGLAAPLPGRMSVGGPRPVSTQDLIVPPDSSPASRAVQHGLAQQDQAGGEDRDRVMSRTASIPVRPVIVYRSQPQRIAPPRQERRSGGNASGSRSWMVGFFDRTH